MDSASNVIQFRSLVFPLPQGKNAHSEAGARRVTTGCASDFTRGRAGSSPDAVFGEDSAVVVDEIAVLVRMGSPTGQMGIGSIAGALSYHPLKYLVPPTTLDGVSRGPSLRTMRRGGLLSRLVIGSHGMKNTPWVLDFGVVTSWSYAAACWRHRNAAQPCVKY